MRADLQRVRKDIVNADTAVNMPAISGCPTCGSTPATRPADSAARRCIRTGGFPGTIVGPGDDHASFGSVLESAVRAATTRRGRSASASPIRSAAAPSRPTTRARSWSARRAGERLKSAEARAIQQVRDAAWKIEMNAKRIETDARGARAGRAAARRGAQALRGRDVDELPRDSGPARHGAGKDQRAVRRASYDLSLVDYEALQQAGPAGAVLASRRRSSQGSASGGAVAAPVATAITGRPVTGLPGVLQGQ